MAVENTNSENGVISYYTTPGYGVPTDDVELEAIAEKVEQWRDTRGNTRLPLSNEILIELANLSESRTLTFVSNRLRFSNNMLSKLIKQGKEVRAKEAKKAKKAESKPLESLPASQLPVVHVPNNVPANVAILVDYIDECFRQLQIKQEEQIAKGFNSLYRMVKDACEQSNAEILDKLSIYQDEFNSGGVLLAGISQGVKDLKKDNPIIEEQLNDIKKWCDTVDGRLGNVESALNLVLQQLNYSPSNETQEGATDIMLESPDGTTFKLNALHSSSEMYALVREFIANIREARLVEHDQNQVSTKR